MEVDCYYCREIHYQDLMVNEFALAYQLLVFRIDFFDIFPGFKRKKNVLVLLFCTYYLIEENGCMWRY